MQYLGGKFKIAKRLTDYLKTRLGSRVFVEPFCGGLNITCRMTGAIRASDSSKSLITLYKALQGGWEPPEHLDEFQYKLLKDRLDENDPLTAFAGYGCSFGGKFFRGYARGSAGRNYASGTRKSLLKNRDRCSNVIFECLDYKDACVWEGALVYCDPPYAGTTGYGAAFNHTEFWDTCRRWSALGALVLISEYSAPPDFTCVWYAETKTDMRTREGKHPRIERLFQYTGGGSHEE